MKEIMSNLFSIIVPVHNEEKYVLDCLNSISNQTYSDYEVILVLNDCHDRSEAICRNWAEGKNNVNIIKTETPGVSNARNLGIEAAKYDWITFLDSDDRFFDNALGTFDQFCENTDFLVTNYTSKDIPFSNQKGRVFPISTYRKALLDRAQYFSGFHESLTWNPIVLESVWGKIYNKNLILSNGLKFNTSLKIGEDLDFNFRYTQYIDTFKTADVSTIHVRINTNSVTRLNNINGVTNRLDFAESVKKLPVRDDERDALNFKVMDILLRSLTAMPLSGTNYRKAKKAFLIAFSKNRSVIKNCRNENLSVSKKRNALYKILVYLLKGHMYSVAFIVARTYVKVKG